MNVPVSPEGKTGIEEPKSKAGDYVDLRAERDLLISISNCPQERNPCNGWNPTAMRVSSTRPRPPSRMLPISRGVIGMMATEKATVDFILDQLTPLPVRARAMFGEYGLYCDEKFVALICDDTLFVKPTAISDQFFTDADLAPPYPGAKRSLRGARDPSRRERAATRGDRRHGRAVAAAEKEDEEEKHIWPSPPGPPPTRGYPAGRRQERDGSRREGAFRQGPGMRCFTVGQARVTQGRD